MPLWLFAVVWLAAWAACRFVVSRWWGGRLTYAIDERGNRYVSGVARRRLRAGEFLSLSDLRPYGGAIRWAPFVATAFAFAAEAAWRVLA